MKVLFISAVIFIQSMLLYSQEGGSGWNELEIFCLTFGLTGQQTIGYKMEAFSTVWHTNDFNNYFSTTDYNLAYYPILQDPETGNSNWNDQQQLLATTYGFNFIPSGSFWSYGNYAYGLYKVNSNIVISSSI